MKKVLLIGSLVTDVYQSVRRLPKGNEEFSFLNDDKKRVKGSCYVICNILNGFGFDYESFPIVGSGVYGDYVAEECDRENIPYIRSEETAGCTFTLMDDTGEESTMVAEGCEYEFDYSVLQDSDPEEIAFAVVFGDVLCGENGDDILRGLEDLSVPVLFIPAGRIDLFELPIAEPLMQLHPMMFMSDTEGYYLSDEKFHDMKDVAEWIYDKSGNNVYIFQNERGVFAKDKEGTWFAGESSFMQYEHVLSAFITAKLAGVDDRNAMMYAVHFGTLRKKGLPVAFDYEEQKHRLVELIKGC